MSGRSLLWDPSGAHCVSQQSVSPFTTLNQEKSFIHPFSQQNSSIDSDRHQSRHIKQPHLRMEGAIQQLEKQVKALTIQVKDLKEELRRQNKKSTQHTTHCTNPILPPPSKTFRTGDRIRITNKVKRPTSWDDATPWDSSKSAIATVTSVTATRVYFTNDNGLATWRLLKHVRHE